MSPGCTIYLVHHCGGPQAGLSGIVPGMKITVLAYKMLLAKQLAWLISATVAPESAAILSKESLGLISYGIQLSGATPHRLDAKIGTAVDVGKDPGSFVFGWGASEGVAEGVAVADTVSKLLFWSNKLVGADVILTTTWARRVGRLGAGIRS